MPPEIHELCLPLEGLLGTWRGRGRGVYPTIENFDYEEETRFFHVGKPFLVYTQRTWDPLDERPLHSETGYWRPQTGNSIELVLSHSFGCAEVATGSVAEGRIEVVSMGVIPTPSAKQIDSVTRTVEFKGDSLSYSVSMAAVGQPLQGHLEATLARVSP